MTAPTPVWAPSRTFTPDATVEALLDASFAAAGWPPCACGRVTDGVQTTCWPCRSENVRAGFYCPPETRDPPAEYAALAQRFLAMTQHRNDLAAEVTALRGQLAEAQAAAVRASKTQTPAT